MHLLPALPALRAAQTRYCPAWRLRPCAVHARRLGTQP
jgi:hypothetical protein